MGTFCWSKYYLLTNFITVYNEMLSLVMKAMFLSLEKAESLDS